MPGGQAAPEKDEPDLLGSRIHRGTPQGTPSWLLFLSPGTGEEEEEGLFKANAVN